MRYLIIIEPTPDGGWGAWAPDLPGVVALGDSREECETEMRSAVVLHMQGLREDGAAVPAPRSLVSEVEVSAA
jgi:predicted RNase H-like HicB family nuclease